MQYQLESIGLKSKCKYILLKHMYGTFKHVNTASACIISN